MPSFLSSRLNFIWFFSITAITMPEAKQGKRDTETESSVNDQAGNMYELDDFRETVQEQGDNCLEMCGHSESRSCNLCDTIRINKRGLVVIVCGFLIQLVIEGIIFSFGEYFGAIKEDFQQTRFATAIIGSALASVPLLTGPGGSILADKMGGRNATILGGVFAGVGFLLASYCTNMVTLSLTYGVFAGCGMSLCFAGSAKVVTDYFEDECSLPHGIVNSGGGFGVVLFAPFIQSCIHSSGWRHTTRLLSAFLLSVCIFGHGMKFAKKKKNPDDNSTEKKNSNKGCPQTMRKRVTLRLRSFYETLKSVVLLPAAMYHQLSERKVFRNVGFIVFLVSNLLLYLGYDIPFMFLEAAVSRPSSTATFNTYLMPIIGISSSIGTLVFGYVGGKTWINLPIVYGVSMLFCGVSTAVIPFCLNYNFWLIAMTCGVFGFTIGANYGLTNILLIRMVGLEMFNPVHGLLMCVQGIGNFVGPPAAGEILDFLGNDELVFGGTGGIIVLSGLIMLIFHKKFRAS